MERLAATAVKAGWVKKERAGGFARRPDAFDAAHLPAARQKESPLAARGESPSART
jgi:hypothetical protein